jgi:hypothetical protein
MLGVRVNGGICKNKSESGFTRVDSPSKFTEDVPEGLSKAKVAGAAVDEQGASTSNGGVAIESHLRRIGPRIADRINRLPAENTKENVIIKLNYLYRPELQN